MNFLTKIKVGVSKRSREKKLNDFYSLSKQGDKILDAGVSSEKVFNQTSLNLFLHTYRYSSDTYTGLGIEDLSKMSSIFPGKRFVEYSGKKFPFSDKEFDWVFSNAVIEHVGNDEAQVEFLNEMLRVGKRVFFTTPNKFFPIETHTSIFFLHWNEKLFLNWCKNKFKWVSKYDPYLLSYGRLVQILKSSSASHYEVKRNRFFGLTMTFTVICHD